MAIEVSSNLATSQVRAGQTGDSNLPYLMQYEFHGSSMCPSFSNFQHMPADLRFTRYFVNGEMDRTTPSDFLQILAPWEEYPTEKHDFRERHFYRSATFGFFHQKANRDVYKIPDFTIRLTKVTVVLKKYLDYGAFHNPNKQSGEISFSYAHRQCHGNYPLNAIQNFHSVEEPWGLFP